MKKLTYILFSLICLVNTASAQEVILSITQEKAPRGQWTAAQCQKWQKKYGPIRGVNMPYPPCGAVSQRQAIAKAAEMGFNSVRIWPSGGTNTQSYINSVEQWAGWAEEYGMTISPVFNFSYTYFTQSDRNAALSALENQVRAVIRHFWGDERIVLWDLWNEPAQDSADTPEQMEWIKKMANWCREEGCTQPISSSIIWDTWYSHNLETASGNRILRENVEKLMDVHNYHDYNCHDGYNAETPSLVNRLKNLGDRPLVCTECNSRTNGSTIPRTLVDFAKYNINFYVWGLYACDANWEVKWERSTIYNWEAMFHNMLYADGEPYNESEPQWIKNFEFQGNFGGIPTTAEYTERWSARRAWRWMINGERKTLYCNGIDAANAAVAAHRTDGLYNTICVNIPYTSGATSFSGKSQFNNLLAAAEAANMTVLPILFTSNDASANADAMANYAHDFVNTYYKDRRIQAWCLFRQTTAGNDDQIATRLHSIFRKVRYDVANQPIFAAPLVSGNVTVDSTRNDLPNLMWQLSDICGVNASSPSDALLDGLAQQYYRPVMMVNESNSNQASVFSHLTPAAPDGRWPGWMTWRWMDREPVRGIACSDVTAALAKVNSLRGTSTPYNSISVALDYSDFADSPEDFFTAMDKLLTGAGELGMTVLPQLLNDTYFDTPVDDLKSYISQVLSHYASDRRILAWDIYNQMCATVANPNQGMQLVDQLFEAAREAGAQQPIYMTPSVNNKTLFPEYSIEQRSSHGWYDGWVNFGFLNGNVNLCYKIWCMSDIICHSPNQTTDDVMWVNASANKFGRPIFCANWTPPAGETPDRLLESFKDMHVSWFVNGTLDDSAVRSFRHIPIQTLR